MNEAKRERIAKAEADADERRRGAVRSLAHCLGRSDVMRLHHDGLVRELTNSGDSGQFNTVKRQRFFAYVCFWFAGLATVVERYQQLVANRTIPDSPSVSSLLTAEFIDILKPFRNAVAHCSDYDDARVLQLLESPNTLPDHAATVSLAFREYCKQQDPSIYDVQNGS